MVRFDQQRLELRTSPFIAAGRKRTERIAVIALPSRDDVAALRLALLDKILTRHFQRGLDRFRSATDEVDVIDALRRRLDQPIGQFFGNLGREKGGVRIRNRIELLVKRRYDIRMPMPQAGHCRAAGGIDITGAALVEQFDALAADGHGQFRIGGTMKDMGHDDFLLPLGLRCVFSAARCPSECRSEANASSPPRPAITAPRTSATAKAGDMAWKNDGLSVGTTMTSCAIWASGATSLSVIATTAIPCLTAYSASSTVRRV